MKEEEFEKLNEIMKRLNPRNEALTEEEYIKLADEIMDAKEGAYDRLIELSFYYGCKVLKKEYIEQGKCVQDFEDEASEIYLKLNEGMLNFTCPDLKSYKGYIKQKIETELTALRAETLEKNLYLNGEWDNSVDEIERLEQHTNGKACKCVKCKHAVSKDINKISELNK